MVKNKIEEKLKDYKLELNNKTNIYRIDKGFNFLGYYYFLKDKKLIIKLRSQTKKRIVKKLKRLEKNKDEAIGRVKASYNGYFKVACSGSLKYRIKF